MGAKIRKLNLTNGFSIKPQVPDNFSRHREVAVVGLGVGTLDRLLLLYIEIENYIRHVMKVTDIRSPSTDLLRIELLCALIIGHNCEAIFTLQGQCTIELAKAEGNIETDEQKLY